MAEKETKKEDKMPTAEERNEQLKSRYTAKGKNHIKPPASTKKAKHSHIQK